MVAIRRVEIVAARHDPLDVCLGIWVQWQRRSDVGIGWHRRSAMLASEASADSEQLYDSMDNAAAEAVEAMMSGMPRHLDWALRKQCGIATMWKFPHLSYETELMEARALLEKKLKNNIATRSFFL